MGIDVDGYQCWCNDIVCSHVQCWLWSYNIVSFVVCNIELCTYTVIWTDKWCQICISRLIQVPGLRCRMFSSHYSIICIKKYRMQCQMFFFILDLFLGANIMQQFSRISNRVCSHTCNTQHNLLSIMKNSTSSSLWSKDCINGASDQGVSLKLPSMNKGFGAWPSCSGAWTE